jgi:hypothetical protein
MEHTLAEKIMLLPPLLVAFLVIIYRNTIFCFHCNSSTVVSNQMMKNITTMIESNALVVRQESNTMLVRSFDLLYAIVATIQQGALMIVTHIQGICIAIYESIQHKVHVTSDMLYTMFDKIVTNIESIKNTTTKYFTSAPKPFYESLYTPLLVLASSAILFFTVYYLYKNRVIQPGEIVPGSVVLENTVEAAGDPKKKLIRRRA